MHSFIYNLSSSDHGKKYEDYNVGGMISTADYADEVHKSNKRRYKDAMDCLKKEFQGEVNWDWDLKCANGSLVKLSLKGMKEYCRRTKEKSTNVEIEELYGLLFINNYGEVENAYHYLQTLISDIERKMKEGTQKETYINLWVNQVFDYHYYY